MIAPANSRAKNNTAEPIGPSFEHASMSQIISSIERSGESKNPEVMSVIQALAINPDDNDLKEYLEHEIAEGWIEAEKGGNIWLEHAPEQSDFGTIEEADLILGKLIDKENCCWTYSYKSTFLLSHILVGAGSGFGKTCLAAFLAYQVLAKQEQQENRQLPESIIKYLPEPRGNQ